MSKTNKPKWTTVNSFADLLPPEARADTEQKTVTAPKRKAETVEHTDTVVPNVREFRASIHRSASALLSRAEALSTTAEELSEIGERRFAEAILHENLPTSAAIATAVQAMRDEVQELTGYNAPRRPTSRRSGRRRVRLLS